MNKNLLHFARYHLPALFYGIVIISISSIPHLRTPEVRFLAFDKIAHFIEYALFAALLYRSLANLHERLSAGTSFILSSIILSLFATFDEYFVQTFSNRTTDIFDLIFDITGGVLVLVLMWLHQRRKIKNRAAVETAN